MLTYEVESRTSERVVFFFYPEGKKRPGRVFFDGSGSIIDVEDSPDDFKRMYAGHAIHGIDTNEDSGVVAWY